MFITREQLQEYNPMVIVEPECWKPLFGYEGKVEVSTYGNMRRVTNTVEYLRGTTTVRRKCSPLLYTVHYSQDGYPKCTILGGKEISCHRAVALSFLDRPQHYERMEVDHIDYNPKNSYYKNLLWLTPQENKQRSYSNVVDSNGRMIRELPSGKIFESIEQYCRVMGYPSQSVDYGLYNLNGYIPKYNVGIVYYSETKDCAEYHSDMDTQLFLNMQIHSVRRVPYKGVRCITTGELFPNAITASIAMNLPKGCISEVLNKYGGFYKKRNLMFEYIDWAQADIEDIKKVMPHFVSMFSVRNGGK